MADHYSYLLLLFFFAFHLSLSSLLVCDGLKVDGKKTRSFYAFKVGSLAPATSCSSPKGFNRNGLKIANRHGPCSPLGRGRATNRQILRQDQARVDLIHTRVSRTSQLADQATVTLPANLGASFETGNYIVTVGLGTPKKEMTVTFDTGSDLTWVQCQPCSHCYTQKEPIFDPTQSSTYQSISCDSSECAGLATSTGNPTSCVSSTTCGYSIGYGDGSTSSGVFGKETLTLTPSDAVSNFSFGCAQNSDGLFGSIAGLLGLGRDSVSLVSQSAQKFGQVFSYCLPSSSSTTGYLTFGTNNTGSDVKFTTLLKNPRASSFYFLGVEGINVGGKDVGVPASTFSSPGTIIDSGTVITRLQPDAYSALRDAFKAAMSNYTLSEPYELFDTCYDFSGLDTVTVPTVALRFQGGVVVDMDLTGILVRVSQTQFCLAFAGNRNAGSIGIIGNRQQRTVEVVYDLVGEKVGFANGGCS